MIILGTNRSISFGDTFLGVWTFLSGMKKHNYLKDPELILFVRDKNFLFLKEWFPELKEVHFINQPQPYHVDIHLHSTQFLDNSKDCPWGYFKNHKLTYEDLIPVNITGKYIKEIEEASYVVFKEMGKWMGKLALSDEHTQYILNKTNGILNEETLIKYPLQDVLYTIFKTNKPCICYRNGLCDYFFLACKNDLTVIYPSLTKAPEWLREAKLCNTFLDYKTVRCSNVKEIYEENINHEW